MQPKKQGKFNIENYLSETLSSIGFNRLTLQLVYFHIFLISFHPKQGEIAIRTRHGTENEGKPE